MFLYANLDALEPLSRDQSRQQLLCNIVSNDPNFIVIALGQPCNQFFRRHGLRSSGRYEERRSPAGNGYGLTSNVSALQSRSS